MKKKSSKRRLPKGFSWLEDRCSYRYKFTFEGQSKYVYGKSIDECEEKAAAMKEALKNHMNLENRRITLDTYYNQIWLGEQQKVVKPSTVYTYEKAWKYIGGHLGSMRITDIEKPHVIMFQNTMLKSGRSTTTVNNCIRLLRQILNAAVEDRIITFNPCSGVKKLPSDKPKATETNHRALTIEETALFVEKAADSHYYLLFKFLLNTGVRIGEALALTWFDVNTEKKEIYIRKTVSRTSDKGFEIMKTPKTSTSRRTIPMTDTISRILEEQKRNVHYLFSHCQWVFPNTRGGMGNYNNVDICIKQIVKNINGSGSSFDHFSVHAFRDTFATRCIEQGMQPQTLKTILGHSSLKMTMDLYAHVMLNTKAEELSRITIAI